MIQNGQYGGYEKEKLHIGGTILIKRNFKLISVHSQCFLKAHGLFSLDYII